MLLPDYGSWGAQMYFNPRYDLFEMVRELLVMFLWHRAPVVADVTLGIPPTMSGSTVFSEAAACWETLHHPGTGTWNESVHVMLWGRGFIVMSPYHRTAQAIREIVPNTYVVFCASYMFQRKLRPTRK